MRPNRDWHYITVPADADGAIAVGAVEVHSSDETVPQIASFSSRGPTADGRIKPDVVAPGRGVAVADLRRGGYGRGGGTSFCGALGERGLCLVVANPSRMGAGPSAGGFALDRAGLGRGRSRYSVWLGADKRAGGQWSLRGTAERGPSVATVPQPSAGTGWCIFRCS